MGLLKDKIVFITGATSGIGKACAYAFAREGADILICARRKERLEEIQNELTEKYKVKAYSFELDVRNSETVINTLDSLPDEWKKIDVLVNNAGLARGLNKLYEDDPRNWDTMLDTNVKGLLNITREVVKGMAERKHGHVINIGSTAGHEAYAGGAVYCASKHAVRAITNALRLDVLENNIRVSTVDPGLVETEFSIVRFDGDENKAKNVYKGMKPLNGDDVAEAVLFCATRPTHVNINEMIIVPSVQATATIVKRN